MTVPALARRRRRRGRLRPPAAGGWRWRDDLDRVGVRGTVRDPVLRVPRLPDRRVVRPELHELRAARPPEPDRRVVRRPRQLHRPAVATRTFWKSLFNTVYFVVVGVPVTLVVGLLIANALNRGITRFRTVYRVGYYLPVITSIVAIAVVWRFLLNPDVGLINMLLGGRRDQRSGLARRPGPGDAVDHRDGGLAQPRLRDDRVPRRAAGDPRLAVRGGGDRRRRPLADLPLRDHPDAPADDPVHDRHHHDRLPPAVRGAVRDDRRRSARRAPCR